MLFKKPQVAFYPFTVIRNPDKCVKCKSCIDQCTFNATYYDEDYDKIMNRNENCVNCKRCEVFCPTDAIKVVKNPSTFHSDANWTEEAIRDIHVQMSTGAIILTSTGNDKPYKNYFDHLLLDACQVTNPSIDPLREPMELKTYLGRKPDRLNPENSISTKTTLGKQLEVDIPILFSAMSYGSINLNLHKAMAIAAEENGTYWNTGEGGLHKSLRKFKDCTIVQVASGRFGVDIDYLETSAAIEIKIGQGAKPGIGGHLPGEKVNKGIAETRMIPEGSDAISPAPHHDIYSIEDLRQLIYALKEATNYEKPVSVKIAAVHNVAAIATGIAHAGADIIAIDGFRGGTGATPKSLRDYVGIPIELAIATVDERLRSEGLRNNVSLIAAGGFRNPVDVLKAIALGADAVYIATVALLAAGCTQCQQCHTGRCAWGITTNDPKLAKRLNPEIVAENLSNILHSWKHDIKEMLGAMGINAVESIKGNRLRLRSIGLTEQENKILGVLPAGM